MTTRQLPGYAISSTNTGDRQLPGASISDQVVVSSEVSSRILLPVREQQTRISQPQSAEINWSNSLTQGLMVAFNSAYPLANPVNRSPATGQTGTGITTAYSKDLARKSFSGSGTGKYQYATNTETDKVTFMWAGLIPSTPTTNGRIISAYNGAGLGRFDLYLTVNSSEAPVFQCLRATTNGQWYPVGGTNGAGFKTTRAVFAVRYDGSSVGNTPQFFINGRLYTGSITTATTPAGALVTSGTNISVGGRLDVTNRQMMGDLSFAAAWNRDLTTSEIFSLSQNPWQIFQPDTRPVYYEFAKRQPIKNIPKRSIVTAQPQNQAKIASWIRPKDLWVPQYGKCKNLARDLDTIAKSANSQYSTAYYGNGVGNNLNNINGRGFSTNGFSSDSGTWYGGLSALTIFAVATTPGLNSSNFNHLARLDADVSTSISQLDLAVFNNAGTLRMANLLATTTVNGWVVNAYTNIRAASSIDLTQPTLYIQRWKSGTIHQAGIESIGKNSITFVDSPMSSKPSGTITALNNTTAPMQMHIGGLARTDAEFEWGGRIYLVGVLPYCISQEDANRLVQNPWQIFQSDNLSTYYDLRDYEVKKIRNLQKQIRISQPQSAVGIDWSNSITKGLVFAFNGGSGLIDLVSGKTLTTSGSVVRQVDSNGSSIYTVASADVAYCTLSQSIPTTGTVSVFELSKVTNTNITRKRSVRLAGALGTVISRDYSDGAGVTDAVSMQDSASQFPNASFESYTSNKLYNAYYSHTSGSQYPVFLRDGVPAPVNNGIGNSIRKEAITSIYLGNNSSGFPLTGNNYLCLVFNRMLSAAERAKLRVNPWQIFQSDRQLNVFYPEVTQLSAYQSKIYRSGVWASVPVKRYDGVQWVNIAARPSV